MSSPRGTARGSSRGRGRGPSSRGGRARGAPSRGFSSRGRGGASSHGRDTNVSPPTHDFNFYEVEVEDCVKVDTGKIGFGKIWYVKYLHEKDNDKKLLRMYSSYECAKDMQSQEGVSVYEYTPPYADKSNGESQFTLMIPVNSVLRHNGYVEKSDIYQALERTLNIINRRFGLAPNNAASMHVSILPANENFPEPSGKVFINFEQIWSEDKIAKLREILCGMTWMLDRNDISGYGSYMTCYYSKERKEVVTEEEFEAKSDVVIPQREKKEVKKEEKVKEKKIAPKKVKPEKKVQKIAKRDVPTKEVAKDSVVNDEVV